jgi:predicted GH43/DUF377 family glycosyl hydrolase
MKTQLRTALICFLQAGVATVAVLLPAVCGVEEALCAQSVAPFKDLHRLLQKPVLSPRTGKFDSAGAFNPSAVRLADGRIIMLYRGQDLAGVSKIGYAESKDGIHFKPDDEPVLAPRFPDEKKGVEDPRLSRSLQNPDEWLMTATAYNEDAQLALYKSRDLRNWERVGVIMPANKGAWNVHWTKSGAIVPEKIKGKYWMYYMGDAADVHDQIGIASSEDGVHWQDASDKPLLSPRPNMFDSHTVEPGPAPLITEDGILLIYNGADNNLVYRTGWAIFDKNDPTRVIARSDKPIVEPKAGWEKKNASPGVNQVPNVVFVEGMVKDGNRYLIYYGAADSYVGVAETRLQKFHK